MIRGSYIDPYASGACDRFEGGTITLKCMRSIRGHVFNQMAVIACDRYKSAEDTLACLGAIASRRFQPSEVKQCDEFSSLASSNACFRKLGRVVGGRTPDPNRIDYAWLDSAHTACGSYTYAGSFVAFVETEKCAGAGLECLEGAGILAATDTAMIQGALYHLIPEVMRLRNGERVPTQVYARYDSRLIAASLVRRLHNDAESAANVERPNFDFFKDTVIQMRFDAKHIASIRRSGFLNQHQVDHTNGLQDGERRADGEDIMSQVRLEGHYRPGIASAVNRVRPKYSFLGFLRDPDGTKNNTFTREFGNVVAVLKDEVKERATFAPGDSLNIAYKDTRTLRYRSTRKLVKIADTDGDASPFWEAQVWGKIAPSDVRHFLVNCPGDPVTAAAEIAALASMGAPVHECVLRPDRTRFEKGRMLRAAGVAPSTAPVDGTDTEKLRAVVP